MLATWLALVQKSGPSELGKARSSFQSFLVGGTQSSQHRQLRCEPTIDCDWFIGLAEFPWGRIT